MTWCEDNGVDYIFGLSGNPVLHRLAYEVADDLRVRRAEAGADRMRGFAAFAYAAHSWNGIVTLTAWLRHGRCFSVSGCARYPTVVTAFHRSSSSMPSGSIAVSR